MGDLNTFVPAFAGGSPHLFDPSPFMSPALENEIMPDVAAGEKAPLAIPVSTPELEKTSATKKRKLVKTKKELNVTKKELKVTKKELVDTKREVSNTPLPSPSVPLIFRARSLSLRR